MCFGDDSSSIGPSYIVQEEVSVPALSRVVEILVVSWSKTSKLLPVQFLWTAGPRLINWTIDSFLVELLNQVCDGGAADPLLAGDFFHRDFIPVGEDYIHLLFNPCIPFPAIQSAEPSYSCLDRVINTALLIKNTQ